MLPATANASNATCTTASQQRLVSLLLRLRGVDQILPPEAGEARQELAATATMVAEAMDDVRRVSRGIHPPTVSEGGLRRL
jgi:signal transduction histidine kinase